MNTIRVATTALALGLLMQPAMAADNSTTDMPGMNMPAMHTQGMSQGMSMHDMQMSPRVYFQNIKDGDKLESPVLIKFGLEGMTVAPAGTMAPNTGHFHLLIDTELTAEQMKNPIPNDAQHMHFGKGQTEASVTLAPGHHTLQLVMGDGLHKVQNPPVMSDIINVDVTK